MKFNILKSLFVAGAITACFISCKKNDPDEWLKDNVTVVGKNPVIASFTIPAGQTATAGSTVKLDLRYWSEDAIDKINLNATIAGTKTTVSTTPYQKAYSSVTRTDSLILQYPIPAGTASGTTITMEAQVVNKNSLTATSTVALKVQ
jgi:hypothetical protein